MTEKFKIEAELEKTNWANNQEKTTKSGYDSFKNKKIKRNR